MSRVNVTCLCIEVALPAHTTLLTPTAGAIPGPGSTRPPLPPRFMSNNGSNSSSKHSLADHPTHGHQRTTSKHSIKAVDLSELDKSPYSSLGHPSLPRNHEDIPRPYHVDLATMTMPAKSTKQRFVPSGLAKMVQKRRESKESRKSFGLKRSSSTASAECRPGPPFTFMSSHGGDKRSSRALEDDYIPPPPGPLLSPELPPPPPPIAPAMPDPPAPPPAPPAPPQAPHAPVQATRSVPSIPANVRAPLHLNLSRPGSNSSQRSQAAHQGQALHSPVTPSGGGMDRHWSVEFEGRMRTLSQNKLGHVKQQGSKYNGDVVAWFLDL